MFIKYITFNISYMLKMDYLVKINH